MRVVHLSPSFLPIVGGTEIYIKSLSIFLKKHGISSEVITLSEEEKWRITRILRAKNAHGITTMVWPSYPLGRLRLVTKLIIRAHFFPAYTGNLKKHLETIDILHFHDDVDLSFPLSAMHIDKPKIFTCHSLPYWAHYYNVNVLARILFINSATLYHVFSNTDKRNLRKLGVPENKIRVVPHGVDILTFVPTNRKISRKVVNITFVGRIERRKGIINLLKALDVLKRTYSANRDAEVRIAGKIWDYRYYRELLEYKRKKQLKEVSFIEFVENLPPLLQEADIFVCPSLQETFGIVNLEAMACGLPVVATNVGTIPEVVIENKTGFIVPPNDPKSLAEKLSILINDEKSRKKMGRLGRKRVELHFSMDNITSKMVELYKELT